MGLCREPSPWGPNPSRGSSSHPRPVSDDAARCRPVLRGGKDNSTSVANVYGRRHGRRGIPTAGESLFGRIWRKSQAGGGTFFFPGNTLRCVGSKTWRRAPCGPGGPGLRVGLQGGRRQSPGAGAIPPHTASSVPDARCAPSLNPGRRPMSTAPHAPPPPRPCPATPPPLPRLPREDNQSFVLIREKGTLYVDKTRFIRQMLLDDGHTFFGRADVSRHGREVPSAGGRRAQGRWPDGGMAVRQSAPCAGAILGDGASKARGRNPSPDPGRPIRRSALH
jgi:hypothetical protein